MVETSPQSISVVVTRETGVLGAVGGVVGAKIGRGWWWWRWGVCGVVETTLRNLIGSAPQATRD